MPMMCIGEENGVLETGYYPKEKRIPLRGNEYPCQKKTNPAYMLTTSCARCILLQEYSWWLSGSAVTSSSRESTTILRTSFTVANSISESGREA